jgi:hypothetical protein
VRNWTPIQIIIIIYVATSSEAHILWCTNIVLSVTNEMGGVWVAATVA